MEELSNQGKSGSEQAQPSAVNLKQQMEELRVKVEAARLQKEKDIEQKIPERQSLIAEVKKNDELLQTARETLEYFTFMQQLGSLDGADVKKLEELQTLVTSLENQRAELENKIATISSQPEVISKLYDAAQKEDVERTVKNLREQSQAELEPRVDRIALDIKNLAERKNSSWQNLDRQKSAYRNSWREISAVVKRAQEMLSGKSDFGEVLDVALRGSNSPEELCQKLSEARKKLGMFKGKEKAAVDFVLSQTQLFEKYNKEAKQFDLLEEQNKKIRAEGHDIAEQFKALILEAWDIQNKINELTGQQNFSGIPSHLITSLSSKMGEIADLERWDGNRQVGKYKGWFNVTRTTEGDILYQTWKEVDNDEVANLAYNNPALKK